MTSHFRRAPIAERTLRGPLARYVVAVGVALAAVWVLADRLDPAVGSALTTPLIIPVIISAFLGLGAGLAATATAALGAAYLTFDGNHPDQLAVAVVRWSTFVVAGVLLSLLTDRLRVARRRAEINARLQAVTLASIGDAVIATDLAGRVSMLNRQAETLTGWREREAVGLPLATVFRIVHETTGVPMPDPVSEVLRTGQVVGLANHTVLQRRDGPPLPIEDSAAPIRHSDGRVEGVVLVFRDATERRRADEAVRERLVIEERFRFAMRATNDGIWDWNIVTDEVYYSPRWKGMLGYADEELPHSLDTFRRLTHPDDLESTIGQARLLAAGAARYELEFRMLHKDGHVVNVLSRAFPVTDASGRVVRVVGTHVDMTARRADERRLAASARRYRDLVELSPFALFVNRGGRVSYANPAAMALFGANDPSQLLGRSPFNLFAPEWHEQIRQRIASLQKGVIAPPVLEQIVRLDGGIRDVEVVASPFVDDEGPAIQVVLRDVTERVRAEAALESERNRLIRLASVAPGLIYLLRQRPDGAFAFLYASPALPDVFGLEPEEVTDDASAVFARVHDDDRPRVMTTIETSRSHLTDWASDFRILHPVKGERWLECHSSPEREADGGTVWAGIAIDVTDRRRANEALRQSQARLVVTLEASGMGTWLWDLRTDAVSWDAAACAILGNHDRGPGTMADLLAQMHPDDRAPGERLLNALRGGSREFSGDFRVQLSGGAMRWITLRGRVTPDDRVPGGPTQVAGVCLDATDVKRGEETRLRAQKLEALGTLAGGIAHDFNNILAAIGGHARLALADLPPGHAADASLREIGAAAQRAAELVRQILTFSRPADASMAIVEIAPIVDEVQRLMRATLPARIELHTHVDADTPVFQGNTIQIHQVLVNLATNAAHAIGQHGSITITASSLGVDADRAAATPGLRPGPYLLLQVHDDGCGMDDQTLQRIFDPFFTTKPQGQGTGLGLSVVHGIVRAHEGTLSVYSQPGKGTTFRVYLPAAVGVVRPEPRPVRPVAPRGQGQHVLYVDDEEALVVYATRMLTRAGYRVTGVSDPREALERFGSYLSAWDAVIADLSMPGISGLELASAVLRLRADMPVLLTTGFVDVHEEQTATRLGIRAILPKPGSPDDMAQALAAVFGLT